MIRENDIWYEIVLSPHNLDDGVKTILSRITGKWLYFGPTVDLHALIPAIDKLVEAKQIRAAKIAKKHPQHDPFPHKPCVLCVYTSDDADEQRAAKHLLREELEISVSAWKSDKQTRQDWREDGLLRIEYELTSLQRRLQTGLITEKSEANVRINELTEQLTNLTDGIIEPERILELRAIELSRAKQSETISKIDDVTVKELLNRIEKLELLARESRTEIGASLDGVLSKLTGKQFNLIHDALGSAFIESDLKFMVRVELENELEHIAIGENLSDTIFKLIQWAEREGRVQELVIAAQESRPSNLKLQNLGNKLGLPA